MKQIFTMFLMLQFYNFAQVNISVGSPPSDITFSAFNGSGFSPSPSSGQLDSDEWRITGLSDGAGSFGGTHTSGDFARGSSIGGVTTGGIYAFNIGSSNFTLGIQPGDADMTPGYLNLQLVNNGTQVITDISFAYKIYVLNDEGRSNSFNFAYSEDDATYSQVSAADYTSPEAADAPASWQYLSRNVNISGVSVAQNEFIYFRWQLNDVGGSGSRDEFALDDISFTSVTPVELSSFSAYVNSNSVNLKWETKTEVNNYGFEILRSAQNDNGNWTKIGFVNGHGNSNSPKHYSFTDRSVSNGKYIYRLKQIDTDGKYEYSKEVEVDFGLPKTFSLGQNYPNPFNPATKINYTLPVETDVHIQVFTIEGEFVKSLLDERQSAGVYSIQFDASNLASGNYLFRLNAGGFIQTKKMTLTK